MKKHSLSIGIYIENYQKRIGFGKRLKLGIAEKKEMK